MGDYKKLRVWEEACKFADRVEQMARQLPQPERRWAFDQLVRAAHSIHENRAEGWGFDFGPLALGTYSEHLLAFHEHLAWNP
jgi:hypothetical protein